MPENSRQERLKEITQDLERGIRELFASDKYADYLRTMSRFTNYSVNNTVLIHMQMPDATHVAGFGKWRDQFGRHVKRGEKAIRIFAPVPYKRVEEKPKLDPDTHAPILGSDGQAVTEEVEIKSARFRAIPVFDVSQTEGKPLPELISALHGDVKQFDVFIEALRRSSPVPIEIIPLPGDTDGQFIISEKKIQLREGMSEKQTVSAAIHEITHAKLHNPDAPADPMDVIAYAPILLFDKPMLFTESRVKQEELPEGLHCYDLRGGDDDPGRPVTLEASVAVNHAGSIISAEPINLPEAGYIELGEGPDFLGDKEISLREYIHLANPDMPLAKSQSTKEVEAESVSYTVCQYYGIETKENSFGYIAHWSKDRELSQLKASLQTISRAANELITDIDRHFAEICKERGITKELPDEPKKQDNIPTEQEKPEAASVHEQPADESAPEEPIPMLQGGQALPRTDFSPDSSVIRDAFKGHDELSGLLPIGKERALEFYKQDMGVYAVLPDKGNAEMVIEREDIMRHNGLFAIPREEWERSAQYRERTRAREQAIKGLEDAFKAYPSDAFAIYQLRETPDARDRRFEPLAYLRQNDLPIDRQLYEPLYIGPIPQSPDSSGNPLGDLYLIFNAQKPEDFAGHSLSVSDIVALKQGDAISYHYVDSFGFPDVTREFEKPYLPEKRPSMLERLNAMPKQTPRKQTAPKRAEMER